jgi:hypothetical protein
MHRLLVIALVVVAGCLSVNGDITNYWIPIVGDCFCISGERVNIRSSPCGDSVALVTPTVRNRHCYRYRDQNKWCDLDQYGVTTNYRFFRVDLGGLQDGWVAGTRLNYAGSLLAPCPPSWV